MRKGKTVSEAGGPVWDRRRMPMYENKSGRNSRVVYRLRIATITTSATKQITANMAGMKTVAC